ncbi:MAG TPA: LacI family DNA-binding transcriptional regulator [Terracidiphilus sp.]
MKTRANPRAQHRKPTMSDVAKLAGVGTMTVSRVLSGTAKVSETTAQRVRLAVEHLQYRPNELARAFRGQQSRTIGLIVPYLYDSFFAQCAHAIARVVKEHGYSMILTTSDESPEAEFEAAEKMLERHVDGIVLIPASEHEGQSRLTREFFGRTPVVAFDRPMQDASLDVVLVQNTAGARRMVEHLIEHGRQNIAFMGLSRSLYTINARFLGYRQAIREAGLQEDAFFGCTSLEATQQALLERLNGPNPPAAIFTSNNLATRFVFAALNNLGVKVPAELALAGFDDFDLAEMTSPTLTVVRQPAQEMGRVAINLLFERIQRSEVTQTGNRTVLPVELVLRRSCGCKHRTPVVVR